MTNLSRFGAFLALLGGVVLVLAALSFGWKEAFLALGAMVFLAGLTALHAGLRNDSASSTARG